MNVKHCPYISVIEIAQYLCREIQVNSKSADMREIRDLLFSYSKGRIATQKALGLMPPLGTSLCAI